MTHRWVLAFRQGNGRGESTHMAQRVVHGARVKERRPKLLSSGPLDEKGAAQRDVSRLHHGVM